jgi:hypothetical protein
MDSVQRIERIRAEIEQLCTPLIGTKDASTRALIEAQIGSAVFRLAEIVNRSEPKQR